MNIIPDTILNNLISRRSEFFDNHMSITVDNIIELQYLGYIKTNKYHSFCDNTYVLIINPKYEDRQGDVYYTPVTSFTMINGFLLITVDLETLEAVISGEDVQSFQDYEKKIFSNILTTWNLEEIKTQVIFR